MSARKKSDSITQDSWTACELILYYKPGVKCETPTKNPDDAFEFIRSVWSRELINTQSQFMAFYLDGIDRVIGYRLISTGALYLAKPDFQFIANLAFTTFSYKVITAQSRPSGNLKPTNLDLNLIKALKYTLGLLGVILVDHLIISDTAYYSLYEEKQL